MRAMMTLTFFVALAALAACDAKPAATGPYADWAEASGMIDGGDCRRGQIEGIDAVYCEFADDAAAKAAEETSLAWVGDAHAGAAVSSGRTLLVLADRAGADPSGKRIDALTKAFRKP